MNSGETRQLRITLKFIYSGEVQAENFLSFCLKLPGYNFPRPIPLRTLDKSSVLKQVSHFVRSSHTVES